VVRTRAAALPCVVAESSGGHPEKPERAAAEAATTAEADALGPGKCAGIRPMTRSSRSTWTPGADNARRRWTPLLCASGCCHWLARRKHWKVTRMPSSKQLPSWFKVATRRRFFGPIVFCRFIHTAEYPRPALEAENWARQTAVRGSEPGRCHQLSVRSASPNLSSSPAPTC